MQPAAERMQSEIVYKSRISKACSYHKNNKISWIAKLSALLSDLFCYSLS